MQHTILLKLADFPVDFWLEPLQTLLPEHRILAWDADIPAAEVDFIIAWMPDAHWVNTFPNLKAFMSVASGIDHITNLSDLRADIPVYRTVSPSLAQRMKEFVVSMLMTWHRRFLDIQTAQKTADWQQFTAPIAGDIKVGVMGYGQMGQSVASALTFLGYDVQVWARSARQAVAIPYFHGDEGFKEFSAGLDALICLIPFTPETENIINTQTLNRLNAGALVINCARGGHVVDQDILSALDTGQLSFAVLDVFREEPLDPQSPFWAHEKVLVTGHTSGYVTPEEGPPVIAQNIRDFLMGKCQAPLYDPKRGY